MTLKHSEILVVLVKGLLVMFLNVSNSTTNNYSIVRMSERALRPVAQGWTRVKAVDLRILVRAWILTVPPFTNITPSELSHSNGLRSVISGATLASTFGPFQACLRLAKISQAVHRLIRV